MKIYTKTGDAGQTGLLGGARIPKDHLRIEAYGTIDELNATLGLAGAHQPDEKITNLLAVIQSALFDIGAELATTNPVERNMAILTEAAVKSLEAAIDDLESTLPPLTSFILPGGSPVGAFLHLARTICRRAERRVVSLAAETTAEIRPLLIVYLNRLSDLLFVMARFANQSAQKSDIQWHRPEKSS
ncbi:Corrinoid adenosyltransferase [Planctomycetales bacterium 10988]|nr:Corrinoid adenosyltransferase [Planctomycetales bacterium 10988]